MKRALAILLFLSAPAAAGTADHGTLSCVLENDLFYNVDRHYTNGVRLTWVPTRDAETPRWAVTLARIVPWFPDRGDIRHGYAFGQSMFTPRDIALAEPSPRDRPYAGWLYGAIGLGVETGRQLDLFSITVGMVGPSSLAEQSQKFIHELIATTEPMGWHMQLHDEPGIAAAYQRSWREWVATTWSGAHLDFTPHVGATLGNVFTYANAGLTMRYGRRLPHDYGPPRIQPGQPGSADFAPTADFGWYLFAGLEGRAIARNVFLDGNSFRDSHRVDRIPLVGDLQWGVVLSWRELRLGYTHVYRTREYRGQENRDNFGAFSVSLKY